MDSASSPTPNDAVTARRASQTRTRAALIAAATRDGTHARAGLESLGDLTASHLLAMTDAGWQGQCYRSYLTACATRITAPTPVTLSKLVGFALHALLSGMHSDTVINYVSGTAAYARGHGDLLDPDGDVGKRSAAAVRALASEFLSETVRVKPLLDGELRAIHRYLQPFLARQDRFALMWWALVLVARDGCLRSAEVLGGALTFEQVTRHTLPDGQVTFSLDVALRKTNKRVRDREQEAVVLPRRPAHERDLDAAVALERYLARLGASVGPGSRRGRFPLFPERLRLSGDASDPIRGTHSYPCALRTFRWLLGQAGLPDPLAYGLHSFRRGGATRYLSIGVPWDVVKRAGKWVTDEALSRYDGRVGDIAAALTRANSTASPAATRAAPGVPRH